MNNYRKYISRSLNIKELGNTTLDAPIGQKWCNFLCQKYVDTVLCLKATPMCFKCHKYFKQVKDLVEVDKKVSLTEYLANNDIIYNFIERPIAFEQKMVCMYCSIEKTIDNFEEQRRVCFECKIKQRYDRASNNIDIEFAEIEKYKDNANVVRTFLKKLSNIKLMLILKKLELVRDPSDRKDDMILSITKYYETLQSPIRCLGGCGKALDKEFSYCKKCQLNKDREYVEERNQKFRQNIPELLKTLREIKPEDSENYNRQNIYDICSHLKLSTKGTSAKITKQALIDKINEHFKPLRDAEEEKREVKELVLAPLTIENTVIEVRYEDGYINATQLGKAMGKEFKHWYELKSTKKLIEALSYETASNPETGIPTTGNNSVVGIPTTEFVKIVQGGNKQGSWIHPDLVIQYAQWGSPKYAITVSRYMRELYAKGSVSLSNGPRNNQQLLELQKELASEQEARKKIENRHNKMLQKRQYHKFKQGPAFYIISDMDSKSYKNKPGIDREDINVRLAQHRSTTPSIKLEMLIYTDKCSLVETIMLERYKSKRNFQNHEWIFDVEKDHLIRSVHSILDLCCIEYTEELELDEYNKQIFSMDDEESE
jgi:hypothetical protein